MSNNDSIDPVAFRTAPVDPMSHARLAGKGLESRLVPVDGDAYPGWMQAVARGFLESENTAVEVAANRERATRLRITGIYDASAPMAERPVGTIASWVAKLTVPGARDVSACAITDVTVAPTHRRRGIARALLEGELRAAHAAGAPVAMLTVSESPLYGRYGFAPAAASTSWRIDVKRASWTGPIPEGRVDFIPRERARELLEPLHARARLTAPGEIEVTPAVWDRFTGMTPGMKDVDAKRAIQYTDVAGEVRGVAVYTVRENAEDFTKSTVTVTYLLAETDDAYAALWRFFIELDLIGEVSIDLQSVDEPLLWMISDQRAATVTTRDEQYLRVLDVPTMLEARAYEASGALALEVADPLDLAGGRWLLTADADGRGTVTALAEGETPDGAVEVRLGVAELSAAYLGDVSLATLAAAGRVETMDAPAAARIFGWYLAPKLSIGY